MRLFLFWREDLHLVFVCVLWMCNQASLSLRIRM
jgi:hypothetical protein